MSTKTITFNSDNNIGKLTFNSSTSIDGLFRLADELVSRCSLINQDDTIRTMVLTGTNNVFINEFETDEADLFARITRSVASINCPVVASINGDAIGLGLEVALACDIRLSVDTAKFGFTEVSRGSIPSGGGTQRLPRIVGKGKALEMILTAQIIDAQQAWQIGLINHVCSTKELNILTNDLAIKLAGKGPVSARYAKEAISKGMDMTLGQGLGLEADLSFLLQSTADRTEGINAFKEKRTPEFKGN